MGQASGFRAIDGLQRAFWDETGLASLTSIPFPPRSHSIRFIGHDRWTVSSVVDQTMADEEEPSCDWQK